MEGKFQIFMLLCCIVTCGVCENTTEEASIITNSEGSIFNTSLTIEESTEIETTNSTEHSATYEDLYEEGIKRYLDENWHSCVSFFESAIEDFKWHKQTLTGCRRSCKDEAARSTPMSLNLDTTQIFYETMIKNALCLLKCRSEMFGARKNFAAPLLIDRDFDMRKPYDYLQLCYYKVGRYQDAANAAVTVLAVQPEHEIMANNLKQYIENYSADPDNLTNLDFEPYAVEYVSGDKAHLDEDFETSVKHMEKTLELYWEALENCRTMCEEPFDMGWFPDFVSSVANHFTFTFRCKRKCPSKLSNLYGEEIPKFVASIFNYLQYGYHKLNNITGTAESVESYLELDPTDATMIRNKQYYIGEFSDSDKLFVARKEIVNYAATERYEQNLMNFIDTEFVFVQDDDTVETSGKIQENAIGDRLKTILADIFPTWSRSADVSTITDKGEL